MKILRFFDSSAATSTTRFAPHSPNHGRRNDDRRFRVEISRSKNLGFFWFESIARDSENFFDWKKKGKRKEESEVFTEKIWKVETPGNQILEAFGFSLSLPRTKFLVVFHFTPEFSVLYSQKFKKKMPLLNFFFLNIISQYKLKIYIQKKKTEQNLKFRFEFCLVQNKIN